MSEHAWFNYEAVINYWFGDCLEKPEELQKQARLWFTANDLVDLEIKTRFGAFFEPLSKLSPNDGWRPRQVLAAVLVLDQFSRNVFRSTAKAFFYDAAALDFMDYAINNGMDEPLHPLERAFLYMPLQHAEDIKRQKQGSKLFKSLPAMASEPYRDYLKGMEKYAQQHRMIIERFGRFPHRNRILGRKNMSEELEYLTHDGRSFGQ